MILRICSLDKIFILLRENRQIMRRPLQFSLRPLKSGGPRQMPSKPSGKAGVVRRLQSSTSVKFSVFPNPKPRFRFFLKQIIRFLVPNNFLRLNPSNPIRNTGFPSLNNDSEP